MAKFTLSVDALKAHITSTLSEGWQIEPLECTSNKVVFKIKDLVIGQYRTEPPEPAPDPVKYKFVLHLPNEEPINLDTMIYSANLLGRDIFPEVCTLYTKQEDKRKALENKVKDYFNLSTE